MYISCIQDWTSKPVESAILNIDDNSGILVIIIPNKCIRIISTKFYKDSVNSKDALPDTNCMAVGYVGYTSNSCRSSVCTLWRLKEQQNRSELRETKKEEKQHVYEFLDKNGERRDCKEIINTEEEELKSFEEYVVCVGSETVLNFWLIQLRTSDDSIIFPPLANSDANDSSKIENSYNASNSNEINDLTCPLNFSQKCHELSPIRVQTNHTAWITAMTQNYKPNPNSNPKKSSFCAQDLQLPLQSSLCSSREPSWRYIYTYMYIYILYVYIYVHIYI
jgi:hypothetical protein